MDDTQDGKPRCGRAVGRLGSCPWVQLGLVAVAVGLAVAVGATWARRRRPPAARPYSGPRLPEAEPIAESWRAAQSGDVEAMLACFTGRARSDLEAELAKEGRAAFERRLRETVASVLGVDFGPPARAADGSLAFPVTVHRLKEAERLECVVVQEGGKWRIREVVSRGSGPEAAPYAERLGPPADQGDGR